MKLPKYFNIAILLNISSIQSVTSQRLRKLSRDTSSSSSSTTTSIQKIQQEQDHRQLWTHLAYYADPQTIIAKDEGTHVAKDESYGFFYDVSISDWDRMRMITRHRQSDNHIDRDWKISPQRYYQENWEPDFSCPFERRVGNIGPDGGKWVCDPHRIAVQSMFRKTVDGNDDPCLIYSIGSFGKYDFERGIVDVIGEKFCEVHIFERKGANEIKPEDLSPQEKTLTKKLKIHYNWGVSPSTHDPRDGFYTLEQTIRKLGHVGRTVDIFKVDCGGCEWGTFSDWLNAPIHIQQLLVKVHSFNEKSHNFFQSMQDAGYVTFHKEPVIQPLGSRKRPLSVEYAFLKLKPAKKEPTGQNAMALKQKDYEIAAKESYGFFYDMTANEWQILKDIMVDRRRNNHAYRPENEKSVAAYYQDNWEPDFSCPFERRVGKIGDGGKWVCDPHRITILSDIRKTADGRPDPCLVYSIGSAGRHDFEQAVMETIGEDVCEIHTFEIKKREELDIMDVTDEEKRLTKKVNFHYEWGIRGTNDKPAPLFHTLAETIEKLGHVGRTIDIFKIDCEGCEWTTFKDWLTAPAYFLQILVEVHGAPKNADEFYQTIQDAGYVTFHKELNYLSKGNALEYAFLKLNIDGKV